MEVIGLSGYARSGKDTVADYLVKEYGFEKRSFAKPLKDMLLTLNPIVGYERAKWFPWNLRPVTLDDVYVAYGTEDAVKNSPYGEEIRGLWQRLGTDCVRKYDDMFWVRAAFNSLTDDNGKYVFTDMRFPNEADAINSLHKLQDGYQSVLWQVSRPGVQAANEHSSEAHVGALGEHYHIENDGTLEDLYEDIDRVLEDMDKTLITL